MNQRYIKVGPLLIILWSSLMTPASAEDVCSSAPLKIQPKWISTLEVTADHNILIADPKQKALLSWDVKTRDMARVPVEVEPTSITRIQNGFFVQSRDTASIIGADLKPAKIVSLQEAKKRSAPELGSLYSNWTTSGSSFLGFGSVYKAGSDISRLSDPARKFQLGFVRGKLSSATGEFRDIELLEPTDKNEFYLLGLPYFAANDDGLFYVRMVGGRASIMRVRSKGRPAVEEVKAFPKEFRLVPFLDKRKTEPNPTAALFSQIEASTMAAGLFGQGKYLYLLTRRPIPAGGTEWLLHQIDPGKPQLLGAVRVPSTASHLSVGVGNDEWFFIERAEVRDWGEQDIQTIVRVPRAWITSPDSSPLDASDPVVTHCERRAGA